MTCRLSKPERKKLGERFAELLLYRASAKPCDMPELASRKDWEEATAYERKAVESGIAEEARSNLLKSGYPKEQVEKATRHLIRY